VDRRHEITNLHRSIAMLTPGANALRREEALHLLEELSDVQERLDRLRQALQGVLGDPSNPG
jgi:hypothetical protein